MAITAARLADRYQLGRRLGAGRVTEVYLGRDRLLDRPVAVKVVHPALAADPAFMARFEREARAAGRLSHPNVTTLYDIDARAGTRYVVTELVEGRTLARIVRAEDALPAEEAVRLAAQVCDALTAAHTRGLRRGATVSESRRLGGCRGRRSRRSPGVDPGRQRRARTGP